jgi:hypothetical protein
MAAFSKISSLASSISAPRSRRNTNDASKHPSKMALLRKPGRKRDLGQRKFSIKQKLLSPSNSKIHLPAMGGAVP